MDPADQTDFQWILSSQGALVGRREMTLGQVLETLQDFSTGISQLGTRMDQLTDLISAHLSASAPPRQAHLLLHSLSSPLTFLVNPISPHLTGTLGTWRLVHSFCTNVG